MSCAHEQRRGVGVSHQGVEAISAFLAESGLTTGSIVEQRAAMAKAVTPPPDGVVAEPVTLGGRDAEWLSPEEPDGEAVVLYLHGGGYCIGSLDTHRSLAGRIAV
ncbi:MAG: hypothetical protein ACRD1G_12180, partial [Acidimicrobiales bacterium]